MKRSTLVTGLAIWSTSVVIAFIYGRSSNTSPAESQAQPLPRSMQSTSSWDRQTEEGDDATALADTMPSAASDAFAAYLDGSGLTLAEALGQVSNLTPAETRDFLAQAFALTTSDPARSKLISALLQQLAETAPTEALELASQMGSLRDSERAKLQILEVWASNDPSAAMAWAKVALADQPSNLADSQMRAIFRGFAAVNPQAAFQTAKALAQGTRAEIRLRDSLLAEVIEVQVNQGDIEQAKLAISLLADGDSKENLQRELINEWASFDPVSAAGYLSTLGDEATMRLKTTLASEWAESDPAAAAAWLDTLSADDPAVARAASDIIREWTRYDLNASAEWLNTLPASPDLDRAVASYTFRASQEDPANAMSWAESINNDRMRTGLMESVAATWKQTDSEAFEAYIESSDLTTEQKETLQNAEPRRGFGGGGGGGGRRGPPQ